MPGTGPAGREWGEYPALGERVHHQRREDDAEVRLAPGDVALQDERRDALR